MINEYMNLENTNGKPAFNELPLKKVTIITGHYGAGKTGIALSLTLYLNSIGRQVEIVDLDIVNPYFRTGEFKELLLEKGVLVSLSNYANSTLDIPSLTVNFNRSLQSGNHIIIDVGGDDAGAIALGRFSEQLKNEQDVDVLYVVNAYRYLTKEPIQALEIMHEIEQASTLKCTGIINNSNLGEETDVKVVADSFEYANKLSELAGIPIKFTCVKRELYDKVNISNVFPADLLTGMIIGG